MHELLDVANAFSTPIKMAWIMWLAWGIGQVYWLKHERRQAIAPKLARAPRPVRRPAPKREKAAEPVGRLITPQHLNAAPKPAPD